MTSATYSHLLARIRRGDKLHMQLVGSQRVWWFEDPHENVDDTSVVRALADGEVTETGDSLFGLCLNSQTYIGDPAP